MRLRSLLDNRSGATTIYVSIFIMIIFILIILSFVHIVGRNHAETVANQLNMQAVYAAETGIADARARMLHLIDLANRGQIADFRSLSLPDEVQLNSYNLSAFTTNLAEVDVILIDGQRMVVSDEGAGVTLVLSFDTVTGWNLEHIETSFDSDVMALRGNCLFVGDPSVDTIESWLYDDGIPGYSLVDSRTKTGQGFGSALAVNDNFLAVGAQQADIPGPPIITDAGSVYTYTYNPNTCEMTPGSEMQLNLDAPPTDVSVTPPSPSPISDQHFGYALAINKDDVLVVGAPGDVGFSGSFAVYKFVRSGYAPDSEWKLRAYIEPSNYDAEYGNCLLGFSPYSDGNTLTEEAFGSSVSISDSGQIAIGDPRRASDQGFVGLYRYWVDPSNNNIAVHVDLLDCKEGGNAGDAFGEVVALGKGQFLAIGAPGYDSGVNTDAGKAYVYQYNFDTRSYEYLIQTPPPPPLLPPDPPLPSLLQGSAAGHRLGNSLAFSLTSSSHEHLIVGVPGWIYPDNSPPFGNIQGGFWRADLDYQFQQAMNGIRNILESPDCINEQPNPADNDYLFRLTDDGNVNYSCLRINMTPDLLYYEKVRNDRSLNVVLKSVNQIDTDIYENMEHLDIQWVNSGENPTPDFNTDALYPDLPGYNQWLSVDASVLRVQITAFGLNTGFDRADLRDNTHVFYLYPRPDSTPHILNETLLSAIDLGEIIESPCGNHSDGAYCSMAISGLPKDINNDGVDDEVAFLVNISSLYQPSFVRLKGYNHLNPGDNPRDNNLRDPNDRVKFIDIQAEISATGNAAAAQVRLSERVPLQPAYDRPELAVISATSICKIFIGDQDTGTTTYGIDDPNLPLELRSSGDECDVW